MPGSMLITRPFSLLLLALLVCAANLYPSQFGGFREPIARRLAPTVTCEQQVSVELDYGLQRLSARGRRARCV